MKYQSNSQIRKRGAMKIPNFTKTKKIRYQQCQENKKSGDKHENFSRQVKQSLYYICTLCHRNL